MPGQSILDAPIFIGRKQTWLIDQIAIGFSLVAFVDEEKTAISITKYLDEVCRHLDLVEQFLVVTSKRLNGRSKNFSAIRAAWLLKDGLPPTALFI